MGTGSKKVARRVAAVAAGLVVATGLPVASVLAAPPAAVSGSRTYACYSDSTDELFYLNYPTKPTCPPGETKISWNVQGPQGRAGPQGQTGAQGKKGPQGAAGPRGAPGPQGAAGPLGAQGPQGSQGAQGGRGSQGAQGARGSQGAQGGRGQQGAQGVQGSQGAQGAIGGAYAYAAQHSYSATSGRPQPFGSHASVAQVYPRSFGYFEVTATVDGAAQRAAGELTCYVDRLSISIGTASSSFVSSTPVGQIYGEHVGTLETAGTIDYINNSEQQGPVVLHCSAPGGFELRGYDLTVTRVADDPLGLAAQPRTRHRFTGRPTRPAPRP